MIFFVLNLAVPDNMTPDLAMCTVNECTLTGRLGTLEIEHNYLPAGSRTP